MTWCSAPWSGLTFNPDGSVRVCCASQQPIGWVTGPRRQSLTEIWAGTGAERLRQALATSDLSFGCDQCAREAKASGREASTAPMFDQWSRSDADAVPRRLEFALSNRCNLACVQCHGALSSRIRSQREHRAPLPMAYDDRFFDELRAFLPAAEIVVFKGGEPFLSPEAARVMEMLIDIGSTAAVHVTTNGTIWSNRVERALRTLRMQPTVSLDALDHDLLARIRVGIDPPTVWENIARMEAIVAETGRQIAVSYCLMANNWRELAPLLEEAERRHFGFSLVCVAGPDLDWLVGAIEPIDEVLQAMEASPPEISDDLLLAEWEKALTWVRWIAHGGTVDQPFPAVTRERAVEIRSSIGRQPLALRFERDHLVARDLPDWASEMFGPIDIGSTVREVGATVQAATATEARMITGEGMNEILFEADGETVLRGAGVAVDGANEIYLDRA